MTYYIALVDYRVHLHGEEITVRHCLGFFFQDVHCPNPQELIDHLVMSPEERGVSLPNYMTARRLPNGAMLYKRNPLALQNPALYHEGHVHNETVSQSPNEACYQDKVHIDYCMFIRQSI